MATLRSLVRLATRPRGGESTTGSYRHDRRRAASGALAAGTVAAILLHIGLVVASEYSLYLRDPVYTDKERKLSRIERALPPGSPMVVFVGTSRAGNGFDAGRAQAALCDLLGRPAGAFNYGTPASGPITHYLHVRRLLADGHRPALLLLEFHAPLFAELDDGALEGRFADGTVFDWEELGLLAQYGCTRKEVRVERERVLSAPWYALRFQIVGRLAPTSLPYYLRHDWSRGPDPNGWNAMFFDNLDADERAVGIARAGREYRHILRKMRLGDGPVRALRDTLMLCRDRGIPVVLVRMPEGTTFRTMYSKAVQARIDRFLGEVSAEFGCRIADCRLWMPDEAFADGHHLLRAPASAFTDRLSRDLLAPALREIGGGGQ